MLNESPKDISATQKELGNQFEILDTRFGRHLRRKGRPYINDKR